MHVIDVRFLRKSGRGCRRIQGATKAPREGEAGVEGIENACCQSEDLDGQVRPG